MFQKKLQLIEYNFVFCLFFCDTSFKNLYLLISWTSDQCNNYTKSQ